MRLLQFLVVLVLAIGLASIAAAITYACTSWLLRKPPSDAQQYAAVVALGTFVLVGLMVLLSGL